MKKLPTVVKKELETVAKNLPKLSSPEMKVMQGIHGNAALLNDQRTLPNGDKIKENKLYFSSPENKEVDHYKIMRKLFMKAISEEQGWINVRAYQHEVRSRFDKDYITMLNDSNDKLKPKKDGTTDNQPGS